MLASARQSRRSPACHREQGGAQGSGGAWGLGNYGTQQSLRGWQDGCQVVLLTQVGQDLAVWQRFLQPRDLLGGHDRPSQV